MIKREWWKRYSIPYNPITNTIGVFTDSMGNYIEYYMDEVIQSWDMTFKGTDGTDMVVGQVWGRSGANKFLIDQTRKRMEFPDVIQAVKLMCSRYPMARAKYIEDKANGPAVISTLNDKIGGLIPVNPVGGKEARMAAISPEIESGNVFIPTEEICPWIGGFIDEVSSFPKATYDDQADSMSQALSKLMFNRASRQPIEEKPMTADQIKIHNHIEKMRKKQLKKNKSNGRSYIAR